MKNTKREFLSLACGLFLCVGAAGCGGGAAAGGDAANPDDAAEGGGDVAEGGGEAAASADPITDTHIQFWDIEREIPWPNKEFAKLYKTTLPKDYKVVAQPLGITGTGIVEASNVWEDQLWVLEQVQGDDYFKFYAAMLDVSAKDFVEKLDKLAENPLVVGIRGFLWAPELKADDKQIAACKELATRGMTMDIISRGGLNPKDKVNKLAKAVPNLRIIIDHLAGAKGKDPDPKWVSDIKMLAENPNVYIKFSSFFDMFNPADSEKEAWESPEDLASYAPHFDVLYEAFGPDRLIWGSNWPVAEMGGTIAKQISLAEEYTKAKGDDVRNKIMSENALSFYARKP